jgi:osmoprotectant transport system permease protein
MNLADAVRWILDSSNYGGMNGIDTRVFEHLRISLLVLVIAAAIAIPLGIAIGHTGRGDRVVVALAGGARALPTLGLITLMALWVGIGLEAPVVALVVLAAPSILAGTYAGLQSVDRQIVDGARAIGMSEWQIIRRVELPLARLSLVGGLRSAALQVIATTTLADYVGGGGLGRFIFRGLKTNDYPQMLGGSILVVAIAIVSELTFSAIEHFARVPGDDVEGGRRHRRPDQVSAATPTKPYALIPTPAPATA